MAKASGDGIEFRATDRGRNAADVRDAQRKWAARKLEQLRKDRAAEQPIEPPKNGGKAKPKRSKAKGAKKVTMMEAAARTEVNKHVSEEAQRNGDYQFVPFKLQEVTEKGKRVEKTVRVVRNLGGSPIERWHARGALDERQMAAILFYQNAWRIWIGEPRVVANWSAVIVRQAQGAVEIYAGTRIAAKEALRLLDQEVFFREPVDHFQVWQNVVIFDEPAGVAGSRVGFLVKKSAEAAARVIVGSMAHKIADIVIDQSRRDFGDLLFDLDAPRRPGRKSA